MRGLVGEENSEKRLVDEKMDLAYKMNCTQMNLDRSWGIFFLFSGDLFLVRLRWWLNPNQSRCNWVSWPHLRAQSIQVKITSKNQS